MDKINLTRFSSFVLRGAILILFNSIVTVCLLSYFTNDVKEHIDKKEKIDIISITEAKELQVEIAHSLSVKNAGLLDVEETRLATQLYAKELLYQREIAEIRRILKDIQISLNSSFGP